MCCVTASSDVRSTVTEDGKNAPSMQRHHTKLAELPRTNRYEKKTCGKASDLGDNQWYLLFSGWKLVPCSTSASSLTFPRRLMSCRSTSWPVSIAARFSTEFNASISDMLISYSSTS